MLRLELCSGQTQVSIIHYIIFAFSHDHFARSHLQLPSENKLESAKRCMGAEVVEGGGGASQFGQCCSRSSNHYVYRCAVMTACEQVTQCFE